MRKKTVKGLCFGLAVAIMAPVALSGGMPVFAAETSERTVTILADLSNPESYKKELETFLSDESIDGVYVIDENSINTSPIPQEKVNDENNNNTKAITTYTYRLTNVNKGALYNGNTLLATASSNEPGTTLSISTTKSVAHTVSNSVNVSDGVISAGLGFNISKSVSVTISGSRTVPTTHNGRKVATMTLKAYPTYQIYTYTIQRHKSIGGVNYGWSNYGTGTCKRPIGFFFTSSYTYK